MGKDNSIKKIFLIKISSIFYNWVKERIEKFAFKNNITIKIISEHKEKPFLITYYFLEYSAEGKERNMENFLNDMFYFIDISHGD